MLRHALLLLALLALVGCPKPAPKTVAKPAATPTPKPVEKPAPEPTPEQVDLRAALESAYAYDHSVALDTEVGPPAKDRRRGEAPQDGSYELWEANYKGAGGQGFTAFLTLPTAVGHAPYSSVLLLHGEGGQKGAMTRRYAALLAARGIASMSIDLPGAGDRHLELGLWEPDPSRGPTDAWPLGLRMTIAVMGCRRALDVLEEHPKTANGKIACLGYGTGAYVALETAAVDARIAALALCGVEAESPGNIPAPAKEETDLDRTVSTEWVQVPQHDPYLGGADAPLLMPFMLPSKVIGLLTPRPLMIQNGRHDPSIDPTLVAQLYDAAGEPKTQRWYDADHQLNEEATRDAVSWLADQLGVAPP